MASSGLKPLARNVLFAGFTLATLTFYGLAWLQSNPGSYPTPFAAWVTFSPTYLDTQLGLGLFGMVAANFAIAFLGGPFLARRALRRPLYRDRPHVLVTQFYILSLALYESCSILGLVYALSAPPLAQQPQSLLILSGILAIGGTIKVRFVDLADLEETAVKEAQARATSGTSQDAGAESDEPKEE